MAVNTVTASVGGLVLVGLALWQSQTANDLRHQVAELTGDKAKIERQLTDRSNAEYEAAKQSCSQRSQAYFTLLGYNENEIKDNGGETFQNHYSRRLHRCLMTLEGSSFTGGHEIITKSLIDTDERKTFGEYGWVSSDVKQYTDQKPMQCHLAPPDKDESYCHTTDEYDVYIKDMLSS